MTKMHCLQRAVWRNGGSNSAEIDVRTRTEKRQRQKKIQKILFSKKIYIHLPLNFNQKKLIVEISYRHVQCAATPESYGYFCVKTQETCARQGFYPPPPDITRKYQQ